MHAPKLPPTLRQAVIARDGQRCQYYGKTGTPTHGPDGHIWQLDHITARALRGTSTEENLKLACATCNRQKSTYPAPGGALERNIRNTGAHGAHPGGHACTVCRHPQRAELDRGLAVGSLIPAHVARTVGCHRASVTRHMKTHLLPVVTDYVHTDLS